MAQSPRLELRQSQKLAVTPQLRQAIGLLQMSNIELTEHLLEEIEKNPLLEMVAPETDASIPKLTPSTEQRYDEGHISKSNTSSDAFDPLSLLATEQSLRDDLFMQIRLNERDQARADLACALVDELDERGYIIAPMFEIAERSKLPLANLEDALKLLQACEPTGVGARNLRECLELQLVEAHEMNADMNNLLTHLDVLASGDMRKLAKATGLNKPSLKAAIVRLKTLNPRPVIGFGNELAQLAIPEVLVTPAPLGGWNVELNTSTLPKVLINETYAAKVASDGSIAQQFIAEYRASARFLVKAMDQRAKTLLNVAIVVIRHQSQFFDIGVAGLRPLTMAMVAEEIGVHESTISRVVNHKFLYCPRGNIELRFFFPQGIARNDGGHAVATPIIRKRIREIIAPETHINVFSDKNIAKMLQDEGIDIARRTVAKYRESMGIPSSSRRRRKQQ